MVSDDHDNIDKIVGIPIYKDELIQKVLSYNFNLSKLNSDILPRKPNNEGISYKRMPRHGQSCWIK